MSDWIPVLSKKEAKHAKAMQRVIEKYTDALNKSKIDFTSLVGTDGYPKPVDMEWPAVQKKDSHLLSEVRGSTKGGDLIPYELSEYTQVVKFLTDYPLPIYDIETEYHEDMGYVRGYKGRCPYVECIDLKILTFAGPNLPVVYVYNAYVHRVKNKSVVARYRYSYSPAKTDYDDLDYADNTNILMSLANLANLNSQHSSSE